MRLTVYQDQAVSAQRSKADKRLGNKTDQRSREFQGGDL